MIVALLISNTVSAQQFRHSIALQTGLFHYFWEGSPILNTNYPTHSKLNIFNGMFMNSYGINYTFCINEKSNVSVEFASFYQDYMKYANTFEDHPGILTRDFKTLGLSYTREHELSERFSWLYGSGIDYRWGNEAVILYRGMISPGFYELIVDVIQRKDLGLNAFTGVNFKISPRFYCYSKLDLLGFVYFGDQQQKQKFQDVYKAPQFPTRFDLSLKFGIGIKL